MKKDMISAMFDLSGRVAIVTGGSGRLGSEFVKTLDAAGARVAVLDIVKREASAAHFYKCDITDKTMVGDQVSAIADDLGAPSILVNNAGIDAPPNASAADNGPFEDYPEQSWGAVIDSHLKGAFLVSQAVVGSMRRRGIGGSIVNISSTYGVVSPDQSIYEYRRERGENFFKPVSYSVAKSGLLNFTRWLAEYGGPYGIRANTLVPGGVNAGQDEQFVREYARRTMLGRMANQDDYNAAILFLASDASRYMTGSMLVVDGGWTAK